MARFFESMYWLVTGGDWEQAKENIKCDLAICDHNHLIYKDEEEGKKDAKTI